MALKLTTRERELLAVLQREGNDVEVSLQRGVAIVHYIMKTCGTRLLTQLDDVDRRILYKWFRRGWLEGRSDVEHGLIIGLTPKGRAVR